MVDLVRNVSTYHDPRCRRQGKVAKPWAWAMPMTIEQVFESTVGKAGMVQPARCCLGFTAWEAQGTKADTTVDLSQVSKATRGWPQPIKAERRSCQAHGQYPGLASMCPQCTKEVL